MLNDNELFAEYMTERKREEASHAAVVRMGAGGAFLGAMLSLLHPFAEGRQLTLFLYCLLWGCFLIFFVSNLPLVLRTLKIGKLGYHFPFVVVLSISLTGLYPIYLWGTHCHASGVTAIACLITAVVAAYCRVTVNELGLVYATYECGRWLLVLLFPPLVPVEKILICQELLLIVLCLLGYRRMWQEQYLNYASRKKMQTRDKFFAGWMDATKDAILVINVNLQKVVFQNPMAVYLMDECLTVEESLGFFRQLSHQGINLADFLTGMLAHADTAWREEASERLYARGNTQTQRLRAMYLVSFLKLLFAGGQKLLVISVKNITELKRYPDVGDEHDRDSVVYRHLAHVMLPPLIGITETLSMMKKRESDHEVRKVIVSALSNTRIFLSYLNTIVDCGNLWSRTINLQLRVCEWTKVFKEVQKLVLPLLAENTKVVVDMATMTPPKYATDERRLIHLLTLLLKNACKHTPCGEIRLVVRMVKNSLLISVQDTGVGMPVALVTELANLFVQFDPTQVHTPPPAWPKATGKAFKLVFCATLAYALNAKLTVESQLHHGSTFTLCFPLAEAANEESFEDTFRLSSAIPSERSERDARGKLQWISSHIPNRNRLVLVVDDNNTNRYVLKAMLESLKVSVAEASNGAEAVHFVDGNYRDIELIMMDIEMPIMDGIEASAIIFKKYPHIPIVAVTAYAAEIDSGKCGAVGMRDFFQKPLNKKQLTQIVNQYLA